MPTVSQRCRFISLSSRGPLLLSARRSLFCNIPGDERPANGDNPAILRSIDGWRAGGQDRRRRGRTPLAETAVSMHEDRLKAMRFEHPEFIPVSVGILPAAWIKHREA